MTRAAKTPAPVTVPNTSENRARQTGWERRTISVRPRTTLHADTTQGGSQNRWSANQRNTPSPQARDTAMEMSSARERRVGHAPVHQPRTRMRRVYGDRKDTQS